MKSHIKQDYVNFKGIELYDIVLIDASMCLSTPQRVLRLINEIKKELPIKLLLVKSVVSVVDSKVMIIVDSNYLSRISQSFIV